MTTYKRESIVLSSSWSTCSQGYSGGKKYTVPWGAGQVVSMFLQLSASFGGTELTGIVHTDIPTYLHNMNNQRHVDTTLQYPSLWCYGTALLARFLPSVIATCVWVWVSVCECVSDSLEWVNDSSPLFAVTNFKAPNFKHENKSWLSQDETLHKNFFFYRRFY